MNKALAKAIPINVLRDNTKEIKFARCLFSAYPDTVKFLSSAPTVKSIPTFGGIPEVIFIGRANVGKSSLINYICARKNLAISSSKPGRTQALNFFGVRSKSGNEKVILVDSPGYGNRGRPEWGTLFDHYIQTRKELRCAYILIHGQQGVTEDDRFMLRFLEIESEKRNFKVQPVLTHVNILQYPLLTEITEKSQRLIAQLAPSMLPVLYTSGASKDKLRYGNTELRRSIIEHCGL